MINALLLIGALIAVAGSVPYILATYKGAVRPQLVSWFVWGLLAGVMTISTYVADARASTLLSLASFLSCAAVVALGWRQGRVTLTKIDIVCLVGAFIGILALIIWRSPSAALIISVSVDVIAFAPTLIHGWKAPREESLLCYVCAVISAIMILGVSVYAHAAVIGMLYPLVAATFNGLMSVILIAGRLALKRVPQYATEEVAAPPVLN